MLVVRSASSCLALSQILNAQRCRSHGPSHSILVHKSINSASCRVVSLTAPRIGYNGGSKRVAAASSEQQELRSGLWEPDGDKLQLEMLERFKAADLDGNGVIDRDELKVLLEGFEDGAVAAETHWLSDEEVDKVLQHYDTNGNGSITLEEFETLAKDGVLLHGTVQQYSGAFEAVDSDHDGLVTAEQLVELFADVGSNVSGERIAAEFEQFDLEHTGKIGFYQFLRLFRHHLLDLESVVEYLHKPVPGVGKVDSPLPSAASVSPGEVKEIQSEEELDDMLAADDRPLVLLAGFTWCRPCKSLQVPFQKLADKYRSVRFVKFYGNANESTKQLFRDRLKARATPTLAFFDQTGKIAHQHTGANKSKLEFYLREFIQEEDTPLLYPEYQLTEKELEERAAAAVAST